MLKRIVAGMLAMAFCATLSARKVATPDFAFPKKVVEQSEASLQSALKKNDGPAIVGSLIDMALAQTSVDGSRASDALAMMASTRSQVTDSVTCAMIDLLMARVIENVYQADSWRYNSRVLPADMPLADLTEWSGNRMRLEVKRLVDRALANAPLLKNVPLGAWEPTVVSDRLTRLYYPTLYDFAATAAIGLTLDMNDLGPVVPLDALSRPAGRVRLSQPVAWSVLSLYDSLTEASANAPAPQMLNEVKRLEFLATHVYGNGGAGAAVDNLMWQRLEGLYNSRVADTEFSGEALIALAGYTPFENMDQGGRVVRLAGMCTDFLRRYPAYPRAANINDILARARRKAMTVVNPDAVTPGLPVELNVDAFNITDGRIDIYRLKDNTADNYRLNPLSLPERVGSLAVAVGDTLPCRGRLTLPFTFPRPGRYIVVPVVDNASGPSADYFSTVLATRVTAAVSRLDGEPLRFRALDPVDGSPLAGANVFLRGRSASRLIGKTGADGTLAIDPAAGNGSFYATLPADGSISPLLWADPSSGPAREVDYTRSFVYPALPVYHPGDTLQWASVSCRVKGASRSLATDTRITATLFDANGMPVDTLSAVTDSFGRARGSFILPTSGLTGDFRITVGRGDIASGSAIVSVTDYKLPTFAVETSAPLTDARGNVTLRGTVMTYSGFPLGDASVSVGIAPAPSMWRFYFGGDSSFNPSEVFFSATIATDPEGRFTLVVPSATLAGSPLPEGPWIASVTATSPSGETQQATRLFSLTPALAILADIPASLPITPTGATRLDVKVLDAGRNPATAPVDYSVTVADSVVARGRFMSTDPVINLSGAPQGKATVRLRLVGSADSIASTTVLYNPLSTEAPVADVVLWTPAAALPLDASGMGSLLLAAPDSTHVLVTLVTPAGKLIGQHMEPFPAGMRPLEVKLPEGIDEATLILNAVACHRSSTLSIPVTTPPARRSISVTAETMRDRVTPGTPETWTLRVSSNDGSPATAAIMLDLYNQALDMLRPLDWTVPAVHPYHRLPWSWYSPSASESFSTGQSPLRGGKLVGIETPRLQTYGKLFTPVQRFYDKLMSANVMVRGTADFSAEAVEESAAADEGGGNPSTETGGGIAPPAPGAPFAYRDSETPLALFRPDLTTDADGRLTLTFTVPNANTTWRLRLLALTRSMLTASLDRLITASKPVMVQPNLPRFLRQGDRAEISALVMNNTDTLQAVATRIEIFNPLTGQLLDAETTTLSIAPKASATAVITVDAPPALTMLGYRVKSSTPVFADGEQALIPLLPASQPVIEAHPFYIPRGDDNFTFRLPAMSDDATVTLEYCENPAWAAVTALPSLAATQPVTSPDAARALFSAAVADGILRSNPRIASALREWTEGNRTDSTLVSMLSRNEDLKIALLGATPWMLDAASDTERMEQLALLFDRKRIDGAISTSISALAKMQCGGGGWSWTSDTGRGADLWATRRVLMLLGRLNKLNFLPRDKRLAEMTAKALAYTDAEVAESHRKNPGGNFTAYTLMRDMFPDARLPRGAAEAVSATVQQLIGRWRDLDVTSKGVAALILEAHNYQSTARQILESLREYSEQSPEKGMWWPSLADNQWSLTATGATALLLDAFAAVDPGSTDIDLIRQWLILAKSSQDWGNGFSAANIAASLLGTSGKWLAPARGAGVMVGDTPVIPDKVERTTGYMRADITGLHPSGALLTVAGAGAAPSWGAVFTSDTRALSAIAPHATDDISIRKELLRVAPDGSVSECRGRLQTGDRVRVTLTIKCGITADYVAIVDNRPACFEPVEQLPGYQWIDGLGFYRENAASTTSLFVSRLPRGTYVVSYDMWVNSPGVYSSGAATIQSQYRPALTANSSGMTLAVD